MRIVTPTDTVQLGVKTPGRSTHCGRPDDTAERCRAVHPQPSPAVSGVGSVRRVALPNPTKPTMTGARARTTVGVATLPTTLPTTKTTAIRYDQGGYTGTIPTEFGLLTKVTEMSLKENDLSGAIPTQLGYCNQMNSCFDLAWNSLSLAIPTQLGLLVQMSSGFSLAWNSLSSAIPTQVLCA